MGPSNIATDCSLWYVISSSIKEYAGQQIDHIKGKVVLIHRMNLIKHASNARRAIFPLFNAVAILNLNFHFFSTDLDLRSRCAIHIWTLLAHLDHFQEFQPEVPLLHWQRQLESFRGNKYGTFLSLKNFA